MSYDEAYAFTAKWEGGLSDDAADRGGITNYGVSIVFLRDFVKSHCSAAKRLGLPYVVDKNVIRSLTKEKAKEIFREAFWSAMCCDEYSAPFAAALFDCGVNSGCARAVRCAQTACNLYLDKPLIVDGALGPKSKAAFKNASLKEALASINARRAFLERIVENNPSQKVFARGWNNRVNDLERYVCKMALKDTSPNVF